MEGVEDVHRQVPACITLAVLVWQCRFVVVSAGLA
jgi:hypothetical protein